jgi:hypothetical protein
MDDGEMAMAKAIKFYRTYAGDERGPILGVARQTFDGGWVFIPNVAGHQRSRKHHPTWEACIPRWVGYPNRCMSECAEPA